jgi:sulfide:quinone oxidoreductase
MQSAKLTPHVSVSPQITENDLEEIARAGFKAVINNRPDGEAPDQPKSAVLEASAKRLGLAYRHIPVVPGQISDDQVDAFKDAVTSAGGPTLAFCRTGTRSTTLWALASARHLDPDAVLSKAAAAGYDLQALRPRLEAAGRARPAQG